MNDEEKEEKETQKIEQAIDNIGQKLSAMEDTDFHYLNEELRDLRHRIIYVHTVIEEFMGRRIGEILFKNPSGIKLAAVDKKTFHWRLAYVLNEMDFAKKVKVLQKFRTLSRELISRFMAVNQIRVYFSHPSAFLGEIRSYNDRKKYLEVFQLMTKTVDDINDLIRKEHPEWFKPKA